MPADTPPPGPHTSPHSPPQHQQTQQQQQQQQQQLPLLATPAPAPAIDNTNTVTNNTHVDNTLHVDQHDQVEHQQENADAGNDVDLSDTAKDPPSEFAYVDLYAIRKEVQCPICLGIIKKTRTVMECLHRFCRECIDKSMRMGNNECPACRTHCPSRRSLRDDPRYDELIAALYPDIKKFEEEELAFYEEDETRNKQIQESITHVIEKQSEALGKKRPSGKDSAGPSVGRSQRSTRSTYSRRRRRRTNGPTEYQDLDETNDANDSDKHLFVDEHHQEINQGKRKSRASIVSSQSSPATNLSGGSLDNDVEQNKEERVLSPGLTCSSEMLAWGRGGVRSSTRHVNGGMSRNARRIRLAKLVDFLRNLEENDDEYVAITTPLKDESVQHLALQEPNGSCDHQSTPYPLSYSNDKPSQVVDSLQERLRLLEREDTLSGAVASCISNGEQLILAYHHKEAI